jgi:hypothetical protein
MHNLSSAALGFALLAAAPTLCRADEQPTPPPEIPAAVPGAAADTPPALPTPMDDAPPRGTAGGPASGVVVLTREEFQKLLERLQNAEERLKKLEEEKARPPEPPPAPPTDTGGRGPAFFNPNISLIGNLQFLHGANTDVFPDHDGRITFAELEVAIQDQVAPNMRYDVFINAAAEEGFEVGMEEGFLTISAIAPGLKARAGRIRVPFGKFNRRHPHQWLHITQPSVIGAFLGPEGLVSNGGVAEYLLPLRGVFAQLEVGRWLTTSEAEDGLGFGAGEDGAWGGRFWLGKEIGGAEVEIGVSAYTGKGEIEELPGRRRKNLLGADLSLRKYWGAYRRLWLLAEAISHSTCGVGGDAVRWGGFGTLAYRWNRYWEAGARFDYTQYPFPVDGSEIGGSLFLTKYITEQTSLRLEYQFKRMSEGAKGHGIFLQILFGSGPHTHELQ